jgi:hypothetical protein
MGVEPTSGVVALTGFEDRERRRTPHPAAGECRAGPGASLATRDAARHGIGPPAGSGRDGRPVQRGEAVRGGSVADPRDAVRVVRRVNLAAVPGSDRRGEHEPPDQADEKHGDGRKSDLRYGERARKARGSRVSCPHRILPRV